MDPQKKSWKEIPGKYSGKKSWEWILRKNRARGKLPEQFLRDDFPRSKCLGVDGGVIGSNCALKRAADGGTAPVSTVEDMTAGSKPAR